MREPARPKPTEAQIQSACTDLLQLDNWRPLRTDPCSDKARGKGFGERGMADHLYIRYVSTDKPYVLDTITQRAVCELVWIEWKRPGKKATPHQVAWHVAERLRGALTLMAGTDFEATTEGFLSWYRASGLMRRRI